MSLKIIMENYTDEFAGTLNKRFRPLYHISTPIGWINDPNGLCFAFGKIHCFAQFYPFATHWGQISWGHFVSDDFVKWDRLPVALYPDKPYERGIGIMSGTAYFEDGKLTVAYAAGSRENDVEKQQIALAESFDGIVFEKSENNPIITTEQIPDGFSKIHFRDPKLFKKDGTYYLLITASKNEIGQLLLFKSADLLNWSFVNAVIKQDFDMRGAFECPDFFSDGDKDIILCSPQFLKSKDGYKHQNVHSSVFMCGKMDFKKGEFSIDNFDDIDSGTDFYAPQTLQMPDGRRVMIAWMNNWDKDYPSSCDGWVGSMIFPRELTVKNGRLYQAPAREIEKYRSNRKTIKTKISNEVEIKELEGNVSDIELTADVSQCEKFGIKFFADEEYHTEFYYDAREEKCVLDRREGGLKIRSREEKEANVRFIRYKAVNGRIKLRILLDVSSAEIFIDDGIRTMTTTVFCPSLAKGFEIYAEGGTVSVEATKYGLSVPNVV